MKAKWIASTIVCLALIAATSNEAMAVIRVTIRPVTLSTASTGDSLATLPTSQTQFLPGQSFVLELWAQTTETNGLSSVTVDMSFLNSVITAQTITHAALFSASGLSTGTINNPAGLIDDIGGSHTAASPPCSDQIGLTNWARVAIVQMSAVGNGSSVIQSLDTGSLLFGTAVCNEFGNVVPADIDFGQVTVSVQECFNNVDCDDAQFCNGAELCVGNVCQAGTSPSCSDGIGCTDDSCDPAASAGAGACVNAVNDANCDDNQFCNGVETCSATLDCQPGTNPNCADTVGCTDDSCDPAAAGGTGACLNAANDANCNDNQFCNGVETCDALLDCQAGTNPNCADTVGCTDDSCDPAAAGGTGACLNAVNDANCDDNQFCNGVETCDALLDCQAGTNPNCADTVGCTDDSCDPAAAGGTGACLNAVNDANCNDNQFCNGVETCDALLDCQSGTNPNCADTIGCTDDSCDPAAAGGTGACLNAANDANCNDNQFCNGVETCDALLDCQAGTNPNCADTVGCTDDSCDPAAAAGTGACLNAPNDTLCADSLFCNGAETCDVLLDCQAGAPVCTATCEHCDETASTCELCVLDLDVNGVMGTGDFAIFAGCFGACYLSTDPCAASNFDDDAGICVGTGDFSGFAGCFGLACGACANCSGPAPLGAIAATDVASSVRLITVREPSAGDSAADLPHSVEGFTVGRPFFVEVWASRTTSYSANGLASVYVDISFDGAMLAVDSVTSSSLLPTFASGLFQPGNGFVSQVGGCAKLGTTDLGLAGEWVRVATLGVHATAPGAITLLAGPSDDIHGVSLSNELGNLSPLRVDFGRTSLTATQRRPITKTRTRIRTRR